MSNLKVYKKIRILHTLCRVYSGGVEQRRLVLARGLPKDKYEHVIITQEAAGGLPDLLRAEGWKIHEIGNAPHILSPSWHQRAYEIAREFQPDIIHGAVYEGVGLANILGWRLPKAKVISEETSDPTNRSWRGNVLLQLLCLRSSAVIGVSPSVADYLRNIAHIPARKVKLINNAVWPAPNLTLSQLQEYRQSLGLKDTDFVIGSVGRIFDDHKRFSDLIRALRMLHDQGFTQAKLLIIGSGPDDQMLADLTAKLNLTGEVIFAGYQAEARHFYPLMDVFALASAREAFGLVLVEAMLAQVPVIATSVGGMPYVLDQGKAGILVPPNSPHDFAKAIFSLYQNPIQRQQVAEAGRMRAELEFSAERYCHEMDTLYESLVKL
ncbi:glycosyltransferase [Acinetobacter towneri]|uniref:glycosyltransferase n=1 Tax=Acinetobacter towneri TaxID=202956 RepID=UPI001436873A|nr:glycosyltransferase [Acinetobacter towneri]MCA4815121.1 glycosyltransferase [Acinetobacter towneri]QIV91350.1 glycosyltransferase [Acinetobacter towneri]